MAEGDELHRKIGVIPQGFRFLDYPTPREAIRYYSSLFGTKVDPDELLRRVLLDEAANVYLMRLSGGQSKIGPRPASGERPRALVLDEPTMGLDPQARRAVWQVIRNLKREGRTSFDDSLLRGSRDAGGPGRHSAARWGSTPRGAPTEMINEHGSGEKLAVRADKKLAQYLADSTKLKVEYNTTEVVLDIASEEEGRVDGTGCHGR